MNIAAAYEHALARVINSLVIPGIPIQTRVWQNLANDDLWKPEVDRYFPCVDIRSAPQKTSEDQVTFNITAAISCLTDNDDDQNHAVVSYLYETVQSALNCLFDQAASGVDGPELTYFKTEIESRYGTNFHLGGFTFADGFAPTDMDGLNAIGTAFTLHYSR